MCLYCHRISRKKGVEIRVLFIGGTGVISSACSRLCIEKGYDLYLLNRGRSQRPVPEGAKTLISDFSDKKDVSAVLGKKDFDVVVNWIAYTQADVQADYKLFRDRTNQYIFISSASAYRKPATILPITENEPLINPFWKYSNHKIECEKYLETMYTQFDFPVTIIRPSHTYDQTKIPLHGGYTALDRMYRGKEIIIHDQGQSKWTLTHHLDFAAGFLPVFGNAGTIGEVYHITSDEVLTWNEICQLLADAAGVETKIRHIPSKFIHSIDTEWGDGLLGDKAHDMIFDNTKIKKLNPEFKAKIPFAEGAREIVRWYSGHPDQCQINLELDRTMDIMIEKYKLTQHD